MKIAIVGMTGIAVLALQACATLNGPEAQANAAAQAESCKMVTYYSASESLRAQNQKGIPGSDMEKTEGKLDVGRVVLNEPPVLRNSVSRSLSLPARLQRDC